MSQLSNPFTTNDIYHPNTVDDLESSGIPGVVYDDGTDVFTTLDPQLIPNLYTADGTLTGGRVLDGDGNELTFDNLSGFTISNNTGLTTISSSGDATISSVNDVILQAGDHRLTPSVAIDNTVDNVLGLSGTGGIRRIITSAYSAELTSQVSVAAGTASLTFDDTSAAYSLTDGNYAGSTYTVPETGKYHISLGASYIDGTGSGNILTFRVLRNGAPMILQNLTSLAGTTTAESVSMDRVVQLTTLDTITTDVVGTAAVGVVDDTEGSYFSIVRAL